MKNKNSRLKLIWFVYDLSSKSERNKFVLFVISSIITLLLHGYKLFFETGKWGWITPMSFLLFTIFLYFNLKAIFSLKNDYTIYEIDDTYLYRELKKLKVYPGTEKIYHLVDIPTRNEIVLESKEVNNWLYEHTILLKNNKTYYKNLISLLRQNGKDLSQFIKGQYEYSNANNKKFTNESKVGLSSDILPNISEVNIHKTKYYASFLTNDLISKIIENRTLGESRHYGFNKFPHNNSFQIKPISQIRNLGNHIGSSTLAFTSDKHICVWTQGGSNQRSERLLTPTGSGSADWRDYKYARKISRKKSVEANLKDLVVECMVREFSEESKEDKLTVPREKIEDTILLGYFRWLRFGGKPEFYGITKLNCPSDYLEPSSDEVYGAGKDKTNPQSHTLILPANTITEFQESIDYLLNSPLCSVQLFLLLKNLKDKVNSRDLTLLNFMDFEE